MDRERRDFLYLTLLCLVAALGGLLFGYDTAVISGAIGFLQERFALTAMGKGWAASSALVGCIFGALCAGALSDFLGRKRVLELSAVLFLISAIGTAVPRNLAEFVVFRMIGGIGVGAASMTSPMYIAEVSPASIRGRMVSINQFAIIFGMLAVYFVNYGIAQAGDATWNVRIGWRWMFGSEALPAFVFLVLLFFVPETPRWLAKRGRDGAANAVLARINGTQAAAREFVEIRAALEEESESVRALLQPGLRRVFVIGVALAVFQQVTGINVFLYYAPEIFKQLGSGVDVALLQTILVGAVNLLFTVAAIWTVDRLGRRPLMMVGFSGMGMALFALGLCAYAQRTEIWMLAFVLGYIACFALSVGPVTWVILSEIFPTRIRGRAMAMATFALWIANYVVSQTFPMLDESAWLVARFHHGFSFWIYGAMCAMGVVLVAKWVPETKGKSLEQIEGIWRR